MRPLSRCSDNVSFAGIGCNSISAGRLSGTRGSRPGCSSPPLRHFTSAARTPYSSCRMPRIHTAAVIWYSGTPTTLPTQVLRAVDAAVGPDIDRGVTEQPRRKHRDADIGASALGHQVHRVRQRQFGDVELLVAEGAVERFLRRHRTADRLAALDADRAVEDRAGPVVIDAGDADCQFRHSVLPLWLGSQLEGRWRPATTAWSLRGRGPAPASPARR